VVTAWDPALDTVEDILVLGTHRRVVLRCAMARKTQDICKAMGSARSSKERLPLMIERAQVVIVGWSGVGGSNIDITRGSSPSIT
jgi:hypothetical protein